MKQRTTVIALVAALHLAAVWLLLSTSLRIPARTGSEFLQFLLLAPVQAPRDDRAALPDEHPGRRDRARRPRAAPAPSATAPESTPPIDTNPAPIDWVAELNRAAANAAAAAAAPQPREFGFPRPAETGA